MSLPHDTEIAAFSAGEWIGLVMVTIGVKNTIVFND